MGPGVDTHIADPGLGLSAIVCLTWELVKIRVIISAAAKEGCRRDSTVSADMQTIAGIDQYATGVDRTTCTQLTQYIFGSIEEADLDGGNGWHRGDGFLINAGQTKKHRAGRHRE